MAGHDGGMLRDLDLSVASFLRRLLPAGTAIHFGPPAAAAPGGPLLGAFLYDVREAQAPASDGRLARDGDGHPTGWQRPVRRYRVSYLLTAWPDGSGNNASEPADDGTGEHELLGSVLAGCAVAEAIPEDCLHGVLAGAGEPVPLVCSAPDRAAEATQLWPGLGVPARTALDLRVVAPVIPPLLTELAPAVHSFEIGLQRTPDSPSPSPSPPPPAADRPPQPPGWERRRITER